MEFEKEERPWLVEIQKQIKNDIEKANISMNKVPLIANCLVYDKENPTEIDKINKFIRGIPLRIRSKIDDICFYIEMFKLKRKQSQFLLKHPDLKICSACDGDGIDYGGNHGHGGICYDCLGKGFVKKIRFL